MMSETYGATSGAINCSNSHTNSPYLSFFRFPKDPDRFKRSLIATLREIFSSTAFSSKIMPKSVKKELSKKLLHPKSRKAKQIAKQTKKVLSRKKSKLVAQMKQNALGEKLLWFRDHLEPDVTVYTPELLRNLIKLYLDRFEEELEQIQIKHSIGNRTNRQHASREDIIQLTKLQEEHEYETCGLELPDIMIPMQLQILRDWNGELNLLPNFKMKRFNKTMLMPSEQSLLNCNKEPKTSDISLNTENKAENATGSEGKEGKLIHKKETECSTADENRELKDAVDTFIKTLFSLNNNK